MDTTLLVQRLRCLRDVYVAESRYNTASALDAAADALEAQEGLERQNADLKLLVREWQRQANTTFDSLQEAEERAEQYQRLYEDLRTEHSDTTRMWVEESPAKTPANGQILRACPGCDKGLLGDAGRCNHCGAQREGV